MRNITSLLFAAICIHILVYNNHKLELEQSRSRILVDQIYDMENKINELTSRKTYEDGLRDGILNRQDEAYIRGYHAATDHFNTKSIEVTKNENVQ